MSNTATTWKIADFCKLSSNCYDWYDALDHPSGHVLSVRWSRRRCHRAPRRVPRVPLRLVKASRVPFAAAWHRCAFLTAPRGAPTTGTTTRTVRDRAGAAHSRGAHSAQSAFYLTLVPRLCVARATDGQPVYCGSGYTYMYQTNCACTPFACDLGRTSDC